MHKPVTKQHKYTACSRPCIKRGFALSIRLETNSMKLYRLYKGFKLLGEFESIYKAKKLAPREDGVYNLIENKKDGYRDSWQIVNGILYRQE